MHTRPSWILLLKGEGNPLNFWKLSALSITTQKSLGSAHNETVEKNFKQIHCQIWIWIWIIVRKYHPAHHDHGQGTFCPRTNCPRTYIVPGQSVAGTKCHPIWHYFAVQEGDILSQETYCPSTGRGHIVPGDILSRDKMSPLKSVMIVVHGCS